MEENQSFKPPVKAEAKELEQDDKCVTELHNTLISAAGHVCDPQPQVVDVNPKEAEVKLGQLVASHQEALASVTSQGQGDMELCAEYPPSHFESLSIPLNSSISSVISPRPLQQRLPPLEQENSFCKPKVDLDNSYDQKTKSSTFTVKTLTNDGYNWRKYGQKLVKNSESSRSYYRCTSTSCHAKKKVELCDHSGNLIEISYKGQHNHDLPQKIRHTKARSSASSAVPLSSAQPGEGSGEDCPLRESTDSDPSGSRREAIQVIPEQQLTVEVCNQAVSIKSDDDYLDESRMKEINVAYSPFLSIPVKEPKVVVQASSDVGVSCDGYRWRKYGQKMVKGNPNPRSYYKCTSAGCPVRKHVERSRDDTTTILVTYEGKHDHDMPVPRKRHGPPSASFVIAAGSTIDGVQLKRSKTSADNKSSSEWSVDLEDQSTSKKASGLRPEKALESARTLLSIGIELRPY